MDYSQLPERKLEKGMGVFNLDLAMFHNCFNPKPFIHRIAVLNIYSVFISRIRMIIEIISV